MNEGGNRHTATLRSLSVGGACILCAALLLSGCGKKPPQDKVPPETGQQKTRTKIEAFGTIRALENTVLMLDFPAAVRDIRVTPGQNVVQGDVLIELDMSRYTDQIRNSEQNLSIARLKLLQLEKDYAREDAAAAREYRTLSNSITAARTEIEQLEKELAEKTGYLSSGRDPELMKLDNDIKAVAAGLAKAKEEAVRQGILYAEGAVSAQQVENAEVLVETRETALKSLSLSVDSLRVTRSREIEQLRLQLGQKKATLANLTVQRESISTPALTAIEIQREQVKAQETEIQAMRNRLDKPFLRGGAIVCDGPEAIVTEITCVQGGILESGAQLLKLADLTTLIAEANVPEEFIRDVKPGDPARIKPIADPSRSYGGTVQSISGMAVNNNGETVIPVRILFENDGFLRPLFNIDVEIGAPDDGAEAGSGDQPKQ